MKIIDTQGLPAPVLEAIRNRPYSREGSDISVSGLISPPRINQMQERLGDDLEVEAADSLYALDGSATHAILEWAGKTLDPKRYTLEKRLFAEVDGWTISGQIDFIDHQEGLLQDYKRTSRWTAMYGAKVDWTKQLNCYRWLAQKHGHKISKLEIFALFRDWSKDQAFRDRDYPQKGFMIMPLEVWSMDQAEAFIHERVKVHQEAATTATEDLPLCTNEEQWKKGAGFAVKVGDGKARKICDTKKEAVEWASKNIKEIDLPKMVLEPREGDPRRCVGYCPVRFHCDYGKRWARK